MEENNEKSLLLFKSILVGIAYSFIGICALFFLLVSKVNAATYIKTYNNNGNLDICYNSTDCAMNNPDLNAYEFANPITISDNSNVSIRIDYTTYYVYKNYTINEQNMYVYLHGSIQHPITAECTDSGTQTIDPGYLVDTKTYRHTITCNFFIQSTDAYEFVVAMGVSKTQGDTPRRYVGMNLTINDYQVNSTPNTSGTEASIDNASSNIINNQNSNTQSIIGNQNQNSQSIIDAGNQNAQDIIDNQNANSQAQIEAIEKQNLKCETYNYDKTNVPEPKTRGYLTNIGNVVSHQNWWTSNYIPIDKKNSYTLTSTVSSSTINYCLYDNEKNLINCVNYGQLNHTITNTNGYIRISYPSSTFDQNLTFTGEYCYNLLEKQNDSQKEQFDYMKDTNIDSSSMSGFDIEFDYGGITNVITAPLQAINSLLNNTCSNLVIPIPFVNNKNLTLPCLTPIYQQHFNVLLVLYQTIITGIVAYWICLNIFHMVHGFSDPTEDKIEVVDL